MFRPINSMLIAVAWLSCVTLSVRACELCGSGVMLANCPWRNTCGAGASAYRTAGPDAELAEFRTFNNGWTTTSEGFSGFGEPVKLRWSVVPDGTTLPRGLGEPNSPSDLIDFLDGIHHAGESPGRDEETGEDDLTQRDWWVLMDSAFERWEQVAGITFTYEPKDDGISVSPSFSRRGIKNVRGDHRIGGHFIDGDVRPSTLAYNYFPSGSDMVIDTSEATIYGDDEFNYLRFRNMLMHEIGHGLGLSHVESKDTDGDPDNDEHQFGSFLMEPTLATAFDGPQFDDILGVHRLYGDANEKDSGNDSYLTATDLELLPGLGSISVGTDADDTFVEFTDTDFVSIHNHNDDDYFRFTIPSATRIQLVLEPKGPAYLEGAQGDAADGDLEIYDSAAQADLSIALLATDGITPIAIQNTFGPGHIERIEDVLLMAPGEYFVRVSSSTNAAQMFQLTISSIPEPGTLALLATATCGTLLAWRRRR